MSNETTTVDWLPDDLLPSNGSQVRDNTNSDDNISIVSVAKATADKSRRLGDTVLLSIVCVGLVGNAVAFSALSSRGCRGRRRRWRTHHALAILLQVTDPLELTHCCNMGTAVKHPVPDRVKRSFVIFDIRAL